MSFLGRTFTLNSSIDLSTEFSIGSLSASTFASNSTMYKMFSIASFDEELQYDLTTAYGLGSWTNSAYKTIMFVAEPDFFNGITSSGFENWLRANATEVLNPTDPAVLRIGKGDGFVIRGLPPASGNDNGKFLGVSGGKWAKTNVPTMTGASSSIAGVAGLVPAPAAGANVYFLKGDGTWAIPSGGKLIVRDLDTVTNTSGSYTHSTTVSDAASDMKAVMIELGDPSVFRSTINISVGTGTITLNCSDVAGTSTVKVGLMFVAGADALTSSEFDVLAARIGTLSSLKTTDKTSLVAATNELYDQIGTLNSKLNGIAYDVFTVNTTNVDTNNLFFRERIGIMTINGWLKLKSTATQGGEIGTISQGHRPTDVIRIPCAISNQAYNAPTGMGYLAIGSNGVINVTPPSGNTNTVVYFSCSYLVQG